MGIFSLEMPADQLLMRLLASHARVDMKKLRGGRLTPHDEEKFQEVAGELFNAPLYIDDTGAPLPVRPARQGAAAQAEGRRAGAASSSTTSS